MLQNDRKLILETLGKKLQFADGVNLTKIADSTEGFTGADLQAVLYTAQMLAYDAVHEGISDCICAISLCIDIYVLLLFCKN